MYFRTTMEECYENNLVETSAIADISHLFQFNNAITQVLSWLVICSII